MYITREDAFFIGTVIVLDHIYRSDQDEVESLELVDDTTPPKPNSNMTGIYKEPPLTDTDKLADILCKTYILLKPILKELVFLIL